MEIEQLQLSDLEMGQLYDAALRYMQSPEFAQEQSAAMYDQQAAEHAAALEAQGQASQMQQTGGEQTAPVASAWNDDWKNQFREALKEQGLTSATRTLVLQNLGQAGLGEAELAQAFAYYTSDPAGIAELKQLDQQVREAKKTQAEQSNKMASGILGLALGGAAITSHLSASQGNLSRVLTRLASSRKVTDATRATAQSALSSLNTGALNAGSSGADDVVRMLRADAKATSRLWHPLRKVSTNSAARYLTPATKLSRAEALKIGLGMQSADDVSRAAAKVVGGGAGVADDAARIAASSVDDVARGAGMLSKGSKILGPVGIAIGALAGAWTIKQTMDSEGEFGEESAKVAGNVGGGLAGGVAGAAAGAAIGSVVPVLGTGVGAVVGGIVGGFGGGWLGEKAGGLLHGLFG